jgi:hypothetical protein
MRNRADRAMCFIVVVTSVRKWIWTMMVDLEEP